MDGWMAVQPGNRRACRKGQAVPHAPRRRSRGFETVQAEHLSEDHYSWNPNSAPAAADSHGPNEKITDMYYLMTDTPIDSGRDRTQESGSTYIVTAKNDKSMFWLHMLVQSQIPFEFIHPCQSHSIRPPRRPSTRGPSPRLFDRCRERRRSIRRPRSCISVCLEHRRGRDDGKESGDGGDGAVYKGDGDASGTSVISRASSNVVLPSFCIMAITKESHLCIQHRLK